MSILVRDLVIALDPSELMRRLGLTPDPWQQELLTSDASRLALCMARQVGKSTTSAIAALHKALFEAPALVLLLSPSLRQSSELFKKVSAFYHALEPSDDQVEQESTLRLELRNGSRIVSLPGSEATVRGYSAAALIVVDEAARVSDELYAAVTPTLATSNGRIIALSTPYGRRGWWWKAWEYGGDEWERFRLTAAECPRISKQFLDAERKQHGDFVFSQEYECAFLDPQTSVFSSALIEAALSDEVKPLWQ